MSTRNTRTMGYEITTLTVNRETAERVRECRDENNHANIDETISSLLNRP